MSRNAAAPESKVLAVVLAAAVAVGGFVMGFVVGIPVVNVVVLLGVELTDTSLLLLNVITLQGIAFPLTALLYLRLRGLDWSFVDVEWPSLRDVGFAVGAYLLAFVLAYGLAVVVAIVGVDAAENQAARTAVENPEVIPLLLPLVLLLNGPGEELLFRGIIQGTLRERFSAWPAIVLASATFAPAHILALVGSLQAVGVTIAVLFVPSLVFGWAYERSENLVVPSLAHGLYNATLFGLLYVAATMGDAEAMLLVP